MALKWLRKNQKQVLYPLTAVVIISFVFLWGGKGSQGGGADGGAIATLGGKKMTRVEYMRYRRILQRLRFTLGVDGDELAPMRYRARAMAAEQAGVVVSGEQLRDTIKMIMSTPAWIGEESFTDREYVAALSEHQISTVDFADVIGDLLKSEALSEATVNAAYITDAEKYLAYCRERDQIKLKVRDFEVKDYAKDIEQPSEEDLKSYYEAHRDDPPEGPSALSTDPRVAVEYGFLEKSEAVKLAGLFREVEPVAHVEDLFTGSAGRLAAETQVLAQVAAREKALLDRYESVKDPRFVVKEPKPEKAGDEGPAGEAPGVEDGAAEGAGEEEEAEKKFRPFEDVRAELEKEMDDQQSRNASRRQVERAVDLANEWALTRPVGADAFMAGLGVAVIPACEGLARLAEHVDFRSACAETGAQYGLTRLVKSDGLKRLGKLGDLYGLADRAIAAAKRSETAISKYPASVQNGAVVWRVADYVAPRSLTYDEAEPTAKTRLIHQRAAEAALDAAEDYRDKLQSGENDGADMKEGGFVSTRASRARPFAMLGLGEVPEKAVPIHKDYDSPVDENRPPELVFGETGKFRVALITDRKSPSRDDFAKETYWLERNAEKLGRVRRYFLADHWRDQVNDQIEYRPLQPISKRRTPKK